jgi:hypothetical protein
MLGGEGSSRTDLIWITLAKVNSAVDGPVLSTTEGAYVQ